MKKVWIIKRIVSVCLIFLLNINSFAAIVSDNDGSTFVTKAEFDALKNSFAKQINDYNSSIDGKVDGAIASYLSGLKLSSMEIVNSIIDEKVYKTLEVFGNDNTWPIEHSGIDTNWTMFCSAVDLTPKGYTLSGRPPSHYGWLRTDYVSKAKRYYNRTRILEKNNKWYNMHTINGNIGGNATVIFLTTSPTFTARFYEAGDSAIATPMCQWWVNKGQTYWDTFWSNLHNNTKQKYDGTFLQYHVNWAHDTDVDNYRILVFTKDSQGRVNGWNSGLVADQQVPANAWAICSPTDSPTTSGQLYNMGFTPTFSSLAYEWFYDETKGYNLGSYFNDDYGFWTVAWPMEFTGSCHNMLICAESNKQYFPFELRETRGMMREYYGTKTKTEWQADPTMHEVDFNGLNSNTPDVWKAQYFSTTSAVHFSVYDLSYVCQATEGTQNPRSWCYFNKDIFKSGIDTTLQTYIDNFTTDRGFPLFKIERDGNLIVDLPFLDSSKQYDVWFTKGPVESTNLSVTKPSNVYNYVGQDAKGAVRINGTGTVSFDVEKGDYVYCTWTVAGKKGGGKLSLPINAQLVYAD